MVRQQIATRRHAIDAYIELAVIARQTRMRWMFAFCAIRWRWTSTSGSFAIEQILEIRLVGRRVCPVTVGADIEVAEQTADVVCIVGES
jgi:hypothetical protein